jgi:hypothetical protein
MASSSGRGNIKIESSSHAIILWLAPGNISLMSYILMIMVTHGIRAAVLVLIQMSALLLSLAMAS